MRKAYALFRMNFLIIVLLVVTAVAMFAYRHFLDDIMEINLGEYPYVVASADSVDGGTSAITMTRTDSSAIIEYELREGYAYPYVGIKIYLGDGKTMGRDLSKFDSVFVWLKPRNEGSVRLYMRGYDSALYRKNDETSLKFNENLPRPRNRTRLYLSRRNSAWLAGGFPRTKSTSTRHV